MRALLAILILAAIGGVLYFAITAGGDDTTDPVAPTLGDPTAADTQDPITHTDLEGSARTDVPVVKEDMPDQQQPVRRAAGKWGNTLLGRVVQEDRSTAVKGATVTLTLYGFADLLATPPPAGERVADRVVTSDAEGKFTFTDLDPDNSYSLIAYHPGFGSRIEGHITLTEETTSEEVLVVLEPGATITGTVTDSGGVAIDGVAVTLENAALGSVNSADHKSTKTDTAGKYSFPNVAAGNYNLEAWTDGFGRTRVPNLNISGRDEINQDIVLSAAHLIAGRVITSDGKPVEGATVNAYGNASAAQATRSRTRTDENGEFNFEDVPEGTYTLDSRARGYKTASARRIQTGDLSVEMVLVPQPTIAGTVTTSAGQPLKDFTVQLRTRMSNSDLTIPVRGSKFKVSASEDGAFLLSCPGRGDYVVEAAGADFAPTLSEMVHVEEGSPVEGLVIRMTSGGVITGLALGADGSPLAGARVKTFASDFVDEPFWGGMGFPSDATETEATTAADGTFELKALTPAAYQVQVLDSGHAPFTQREIQVAEGRAVDLGSLRLTAGASLSGTVSVGSEGAGGVLVQLILDAQAASDKFGAYYSTRTNSEGRYSFPHTPPGPYNLSVQRQQTGDTLGGFGDVGSTRRVVVLTEGGQSTEDFTLD
jgi:Carboxypeptidase regulatory-like domain